MNIGKLEIDLKELAEFIVEGKKSCYAGDCDHMLLPDGSKLLTFQKGNFFYEDNYAGFYQAPGRELVKWKTEDGQRIWQMTYSGGMLSEFWGNEKIAEETFEFLRKALSQITPEKPFRGPRLFQDRDSDKNLWSYVNISKGDLQQFRGDEIITTEKEPIMVFSQNYIGGLVIPK
jgi:hypothetical protein